MKIAIAQLDPVVGAFDSNFKKIAEFYERACSEQVRLLLTPELVVCGYPPHDLLVRPEIFERNDEILQKIAHLTKDKKTALAVGHVARNPNPHGRMAQNVVSIFEDGNEVFRQAKMLLPTYDVFDEARYFEPATETHLWECDGRKVAIAICEDLWAYDPQLGRNLYGRAPVEEFKKLGADLIFSLSASPYEWAKRERREALHADVAKMCSTALVYVNQVGATDEILFDGGSFALDSSGKLRGRLPMFVKSYATLEIDDVGSISWLSDASKREDQAPKEIESLTRALVTGIRDYFSKTHFKMAIVGLSGGIDSALVAVLAAKALGPKNVLGVGMSSQYSSAHSREDAEELAARLGIQYSVHPIKFAFATLNRELSEPRGPLVPIAQENLQARLRGLILMTLANHYGALVLTTGNKSELATGYCTQYGDMVGALAPIGDVFKTRVYELVHYINEEWGAPIPERSISKPPSAELRPDQKDEDSLPPYDVLDSLLKDYLEEGASIAKLEERYHAMYQPVNAPKHGSWVKDIIRRLEMNEYKRRQAAPVLKVSRKAFGIGRRIPIAKTWDA